MCPSRVRDVDASRVSCKCIWILTANIVASFRFSRAFFGAIFYLMGNFHYGNMDKMGYSIANWFYYLIGFSCLVLRFAAKNVSRKHDVRVKTVFFLYWVLNSINSFEFRFVRREQTNEGAGILRWKPQEYICNQFIYY